MQARYRVIGQLNEDEMSLGRLPMSENVAPKAIRGAMIQYSKSTPMDPTESKITPGTA